MTDRERLLESLVQVLDEAPPPLPAKEVQTLVSGFLARAREFLETRDREGSPLYVFEPEVLRGRARRFGEAFSSRITGFEPYFAVKSNNHPWVMSELVSEGLGLDVSSGIELGAALDAGCDRILFSGPGKTADELALAASSHERVTVLMDSPGELERLAGAARARQVTVRAGVRLTTQEDGLWRKFGVPLSRLGEIIGASRDLPVRLSGLQFHTSWNLSPEAQVGFIARLGRTLSTLPREALGAVEFLDIGGGYWPPAGEWLLPSATRRGRIVEILDPHMAPPQERTMMPAEPIEVFADRISRALEEHVFPHVTVRVLAEPGRWICNDAMHILMTIVDRKADDLVIADAGTNIVGWERFESDYVPLVNLTRPSLEERTCLVCGSLCTPHDIWGFSYFGSGIEPGDVILVPCQGAYTWSLRQEFIKPLARVVRLA